jgi:hypothetical protein
MMQQGGGVLQEGTTEEKGENARMVRSLDVFMHPTFLLFTRTICP